MIALPTAFVLLVAANSNTARACATATDAVKQIAVAITDGRPEMLGNLATTMADVAYLQNPRHTIREYDPADAAFAETIRNLLASRTEPEYPEAALVSLTNEDAETDTRDSASQQFDVHVRDDIRRQAELLAQRFKGWRVVSATPGELTEENAIEAIAPAVDVYRDSQIRLRNAKGRERTIFVRELWRVGSCWRIAELDVGDEPFKSGPPVHVTATSQAIAYAPAVEFWKSYAMDQMQSSVSRRLQMFWISAENNGRINRTPLAEIADRSARLNGLRAAVDAIVDVWKLTPDKTWGEYERGTPSWLFAALTGVQAKSFAEASEWWTANRDRVALDTTGNALTAQRE